MWALGDKIIPARSIHSSGQNARKYVRMHAQLYFIKEIDS